MSYKTCLFVALLVSYIKNGESLYCYTCASPDNLMCGSDFSTSKVAALHCKTDENLCLKASTTVLGVTVVTRTCGVQESCQLFDKCNTCSSDKCNSSSNVQFQFMLLPLAGLIFVKSYF
ncbi:hypothetical protein PPYR_12533 [Photinus pyralis]|uniref:Protein sleepless n=1 Tax=Photinus pyralis TaxID=7054 RepID=A0A5N4A6H8_PHOPY|nr:uncharacterized protein LOC116178728 [Photinus pyralis]KAB0792913.1 hypothetical protein PPYR_12533 [Photinus pyralis]